MFKELQTININNIVIIQIITFSPEGKLLKVAFQSYSNIEHAVGKQNKILLSRN